MYQLLKHSHIALASVSVAFFALRALWAQQGKLDHVTAWVKRLPHLIDTLLLLTGLSLIALTHITPTDNSWLALKLMLLIAYILLGALGLRYAPSSWRGPCCLLALCSAGAMASLALFKPALW
ncbi:SirB2 family protein [Aestuariicella hydrocarbonica]|uniref:SirB2 family protein n=1 Tax=Pseudomaricurvus hydrocarbonicus TaxID=1470433 RepID=A0A9E5MMT9_9GAMM|nr:SirB2 family protein [Aestuariicella hydrocarbonica]NHO67136.1 SirB2 family protein [Aestuariicella hydrocarbonica]